MSNGNAAKVIAIDGPSGSGKSTIAKNLAKTLGVLYIDTGAMFRAIAYVASSSKIELVEGRALNDFLGSLKIDYGVSDSILIKINGEDLTDKIREHHISKLASSISQLPSVREFLLGFQRSLAKDHVCVMEGRDIGTVVFPDSFCKFYITASAEIRAKRRLNQLKQSGDHSLTLEQVIEDVSKRDETDMNRAYAPLKKADDAVLLDTTNMEMGDVIEFLKKHVLLCAHKNGISV